MLKKKYVFAAIAGLLVITAGILAAVYLNGRKHEEAPPLALEADNNIQTDLPEAGICFVFNTKRPDNAAEVLGELEKKAKSELNIKLYFEFYEAGADTFLNATNSATASGESFDGFYYPYEYPDQLISMAENDQLTDLTDLFQKCAPTYYNMLSDEELKSVSVNNRIYAMPRVYHSAKILSALVRDDLMQKYNIPEIKSYADYELYLKAVKENEKDITPMAIRDTTIGLFAQPNGYVTLDYRQGLVYKWDDPEMKITAWEQTQEFAGCVEKINSWFTKGYLTKDAPVMQLDSGAIGSGRWASVISYYGDEISYNTALKDNGISWSYKAYPLNTDQPSEMNSMVNGAIAIPKASKNAERVLMFMNWLYSSQENYDALMYGIEGKTYTLKNDKVNIPDGIKLSNSCLNWGWRSAFLNEKLERGNMMLSKDTLDGYFENIKKLAKFAPHAGFMPDYTSVKNIANNREISFYAMDRAVYMGQYKKEDVDKYVKEQKDYGVDSLVAEIQKQLNDWKAK